MKIAIFIPVRLGSTRLTKKALADIAGKPAIQYLMERVKLSEAVSDVVLCTTAKKDDDALVELADKNGIQCFRGSEYDILDRFLRAAEKYGIDLIVNVDGDDILCDPKLIDELVDYYRGEKTKPDFIRWRNLPLGISPVGIRVEALKTVCRMKDTEKTDTGWGKYFTESGQFLVKELTKEKHLSRPDIRLTLDYPEDLHLISEVVKRLGENGPNFHLADIIRLFEDHPELLKINERVADGYWKRFNELSKIKIKAA